jgi:hypothetical protein
VPEQGRDKAGARLLPSGVYARWLAED